MSGTKVKRADPAGETPAADAPSAAEFAANAAAARAAMSDEDAKTQRGFERIARLEALKLVFRADWLATDAGRIIRETERLAHFVVHGVDPGPVPPKD